MTAYRAGQRVRIEVEGVLTEGGGMVGPNHIGLVIQTDGGFYTPFTYPDGSEAGIKRQATVTVLSDPRPDEPQGLGAVVEAGDGWWWVRVYNHGNAEHPWRSQDGSFAHWDELPDPVRVMSEGWTPPPLHGFADAYGMAECTRCLHVRKEHSDAGPCAVGLCQCGEFES